MRGYITLAASAAAILAASPSLAQTAGVTFSNYQLGTLPFNLGYAFSLSQNLSVSALGVFDAGGNGFQYGPIQVGLWNNSGALLASTWVNSGSILFQEFRYEGIQATALSAGQTYFVGANYPGTPSCNSCVDQFGEYATVTNSPGVNYLYSAYAGGPGFARPTNSFGTDNLLSANFLTGPLPSSAVPEPASWAMMIGGFGMIGGALRGRRRKVGVRFV